MSTALRVATNIISLPQMIQFSKLNIEERVGLLAQLVGKPVNQGWEGINEDMTWVKAEYQEMLDAIEAKDATNLRAEISDLMTCLYYLAYRAGFPIAKDMDEIVLSNLTKLDNDENTIIEAVYQAELNNVGAQMHLTKLDLVDTSEPRPLAIAIVNKDSNGKDGRFYAKAKWLKPAHFAPPELTRLPIAVQEKLEMVEVRRDVARFAYGQFVELTEDGMIVRAIDDMTFDDGSRWTKGELLFARRDNTHPLQ